MDKRLGRPLLSEKDRPWEWETCPECERPLLYVVRGETYSHVMSIYDRDRDRTVAWGCPFCKMRWERAS